MNLKIEKDEIMPNKMTRFRFRYYWLKYCKLPLFWRYLDNSSVKIQFLRYKFLELHGKNLANFFLKLDSFLKEFWSSPFRNREFIDFEFKLKIKNVE